MAEAGRSGMTMSRYPGQRVLVNGGQIVIRVSEVKGKRVYLYIEAPRDVRIDRPGKDEDRRDREHGFIRVPVIVAG